MSTPRPALPHEGRGEISTLAMLHQRYRCNYISVEQLLADHLTQYRCRRTLREAIREGRVNIEIKTLGPGRKAPRVIYLRDLADFLDRAEETAANQTA